MPDSRTTRRVTRARDVQTIRHLLRSGEGARALQCIGDRWSFLLLRDAFVGVRRFEDLRRLTGASRGTLTARLNALVEQGILYRSPYGNAPSRLEYRLTEKGLAFYPIALCLWIWENRWGGEFGLPPSLVHARCGKVLKPVMTCGHCETHVQPQQVEFEPGPGAEHYASGGSSATRRRQGPPTTPGDGVDTTMFHSVDTVGDRWTALLVAALFFGLHRYDDISAALGIATNILADRLRRLLAAGVIEQHLYQDRPPRHEYRLTAKGWDLFPFTVALHDWGSHWIPSPHGPGLKLRHTPCGHRLRGVMICGACETPIEPHEVEIRGATRWAARRERPGKKARGKTARHK
jgi:DNA-binding HxlR family transcriptional regulator